MTDDKNELIKKIYDIYKQNGYVSEDTVFDLIIDAGIALNETDRVCDELLAMGVLIRDDSTALQEIKDKDDDFADSVDYAQIDYEEVYEQVLRIDPTLDYIIGYVRQVPPPKQHEANNLMIQAKAGNDYAVNRLIEMLMRVAVRIALNFSEKYHTNIGETIQYALEGLVIAYEKFEIGRQDNFTTYAPWWIRQNIDRKMDICTSIHTPVHIDEQIKQISKLMDMHFCSSCMQYNICRNLIAEICDKVKIDEKKAVTYIMFLTPSLSIEELAENEKEPVYYDFFEDICDEILHRELEKTIRTVLHTLTPKEEKIIIMRYGLDDGTEKTLEEIGIKFNVTRERIRQIENRAFEKLRHPSRSKKLRGFFEEL